MVRHVWKLVPLVILTACSGGSSGSSSGTTGTLNVEVTDAPFTSAIVRATLEVDRVDAHVSGQGGFQRIDNFTAPVSFDLLQLTGGVTASLLSATVPAGQVTQLRLYFSKAEVELSDGRILDLTIPSSQNNGLRITLAPPATVAGGLTTDLLVDIDTSKSFVPQGNPSQSGLPGVFDDPAEITDVRFNPVARAVNQTTQGRVVGTVVDGQGTPTDPGDDVPLAGATVRAFSSGVEVASTVSTATGSYALLGLDPGDYTIQAEATGFVDASASATVVEGNQTAVDLTLQP